jgi:hypothetical protein
MKKTLLMAIARLAFAVAPGLSSRLLLVLA